MDEDKERETIAFLQDNFSLSEKDARKAALLLESFATAANAPEPQTLNIRELGVKLTLPSKAPELYAERADRNEKADTFLKRVWQPWIDAESLYQHKLRKLDPALMKALENQFVGKKAELAVIIPKKSAEVTKRLETLVGRTLTEKERSKALSAEKFLPKLTPDS